jgi:ribosomal protein S30
VIETSTKLVPSDASRAALPGAPPGRAGSGKLGHLRRLHEAARAGRRLYGQGYLASMISALRLAAFHEFSPKEIVSYGLYAGKVRAQLPVLVSKQRSLAKLRRGNPRHLERRTEDKVEFHRCCEAHGLAVPRLLGTFGPDEQTTADGRLLAGAQAWAEHFARTLPQAFVVKDAAGAYSSGFATYARDGDRFVDQEGRATDGEGLYRRLKTTGRRLILQERLFDHPELTRLAGRKTLQSMRIATCREDDGTVRLLYWFLKLVGETSLTDNFLAGTSGNMMAHGDPDRGILRGGKRLSDFGTGLVAVTHHPRTGIALDGFEVPRWAEAVDLARTAHAEAFPEFCALGWDVAVTADGPVLLEANAWFDPPSHTPHIMSAADWKRIFG